MPDDIDELLRPSDSEPAGEDDVDELLRPDDPHAQADAPPPASPDEDLVSAANREVHGTLGDYGMGMLSGSLFNFGDELGDIGANAANAYTGHYEDNAAKSNPIRDAEGTQAGKIGSVVGNSLSGVALGAATGGLGGYAAQAGIGAGASALGGVGSRSGEGRWDVPEMLKDAAIGGVLGAAGRGVGNLIGRARIQPKPIMAASDSVGDAGAEPWLQSVRARMASKPVPTAYDELVSKPSGLELETITPTRQPAVTLDDIPYDPGAVRAAVRPNGPNGTARMQKPETVNMRASDTVPDLPYEQIPTVRDMPMPSQLATVPDRAMAQTAGAPFRRPQYAELGPSVPELGPQAAQPGVQQAGVGKLLALKDAAAKAGAPEAADGAWKQIMDVAPALLGGRLPVSVRSDMARRILGSAGDVAGRLRGGSTGFTKPSADTLKIAQIGMKGLAPYANASTAEAQAAPVARPDVPTLTWAMQSVNAGGDTGLPPDAQQRFDEVLMSGDDNKISSAFMQYSMRYPAFQKRVAAELESINDSGG